MEGLVIPFVVTFLVAFVGGVVSYDSLNNSNWYERLRKPEIVPPRWVFGLVWTILYVLYAVSWFLNADDYNIYWIFAVHIALNLLWSLVFFSDHDPAGALALLTLMIFTLVYIICNITNSVWSQVILLPYLAWLLLAFIFNYEIVRCNKMKDKSCRC